MSKTTTTTTTTESTEKTTWTTWEELLLACAVKRHGPKDWDSVAMELQSRSSADESVVLTAQICRSKYRDLKRRFMDADEEDSRTGDEADDDSIPWLEELRKLRVAELKQEVHRYDLSIQSLQLKVKRLEEDRERNENEDGEKPDLEKTSTKEEGGSENDKKDGGDRTTPPVAASPAAGRSDSDRSFNESNSTENRESGGEKAGTELVQAGSVKPDPESKPVVGEDSCNDSSDTVAKHAAASKKKLKKKNIEPDGSTELRDSAAESKGGTTMTTTKESSDVQSSASLTKKRRCGGGVDEHLPGVGGGGGEEQPVVSPASTIKRESMGKSEPLVVNFLDVIRSHKHGSVFKRRLESQKTEKYKNMIRQHVDLETVNIRIKDGSYSSCTTKFYMDLLLLFTNVITFFPKSSTEYAAAHELRDLVLKEIKRKRIGRQVTNVAAVEVELPAAEASDALVKPKPDPEKSDSLLAKHKSSAPIVVSRKRSSSTLKPSTSNKVETKLDEKDKPPSVVKAEKPAAPTKSPVSEEESSLKLKAKEKPATTGARSMRKGGSIANIGSRTTPTSTSTPNNTSNKNNPGPTNKVREGGGNSGGGPQKAETKKKPEVTTTVKKRGAADFLKRIKKNSPGKGGTTVGAAAVEEKKSSAWEGGGDNSNGGSGKREQQKKRAVDERKEGTSRLRSSGKQTAVNDDSLTKRAVGRPPKKGKETIPAKRGRESGGGEAETAAKRPKKRTRR